MNCKPGDLAYLSSECLDEGKIVEVLSAAPCSESLLPAWHCRARDALNVIYSVSKREGFDTETVIEDRHLRPITGVPLVDEMPLETNVPEALQLALGIESRSYA